MAEGQTRARYLLAGALRGLGQEADASLQMQEARRLVQVVRNEAGDDVILRRSDLAAIIAGSNVAISPPASHASKR